MTEPWEQLRAAQEKEYGTWYATEPIYVGTALAYYTGDAVPTSNVEAHGYDKAGLVARRGAAHKPSAAPTSSAK